VQHATSGRPRVLAKKLVAWFRKNRRDLPWRRRREPYRVWVSEVMLQQTRAEVVGPYYERFLEAFPDLGAVARARLEDVLARWSGLGYYDRARRLHRAARIVLERYGGELPRDPKLLGELPGFGPYTAAAVASIAYGIPEPALDGNGVRVLCRLLARQAPRGGARNRLLLEAARRLVEADSAPGEVNEALMELGATVCTPRTPRCGICPLERDCEARARGKPEAYPGRKPPRSRTRCRVAVALVGKGKRFLLERPSRGNPFRGSWELPAVELPEGSNAARALESALRRRHGVHVRAARTPVARATHGILQRSLRLELFPCTLVQGSGAPGTTARWTAPAELDRLHVSSATRKLLALAAGISSATEKSR